MPGTRCQISVGARAPVAPALPPPLDSTIPIIFHKMTVFEPELASLVGLQVLSSKEREEEGGKLFDKILYF